MNKYDYITATTLEEKVRLEKLIKYMEDNNIEDNLLEYKERYNNICKYLVEKNKYLQIEKSIDDIRLKLDELYKKKDEYEVDNLLLEETLFSKFKMSCFIIFILYLYAFSAGVSTLAATGSSTLIKPAGIGNLTEADFLMASVT